jgi:hypothetical protein
MWGMLFQMHYSIYVRLGPNFTTKKQKNTKEHKVLWLFEKFRGLWGKCGVCFFVLLGVFVSLWCGLGHCQYGLSSDVQWLFLPSTLRRFSRKETVIIVSDDRFSFSR